MVLKFNKSSYRLVVILGFLMTIQGLTYKNSEWILPCTEDSIRVMNQMEELDIDVVVELVKEFESFSSTTYVCPAGVTTIGYGFTGELIKGREFIDEITAEEELKELLMNTYCKLDSKYELDSYQLGALTSFVFNLGITKFNKTTLRKRLQDKEEVCKDKVLLEELPKFVYSGNNKLKGLEIRRSKELELLNRTSNE